MVAAEDYMEASGVNFSLFHEHLLNQIAMSDLDLCRVLGNLLNNAIEHTAQTVQKAVSLSVQTQTASKGIVMISNSVDTRISTAKLFREGCTTKQGHSGHGLTEVNKILGDYYGCTIMPSCTDSTFTMYLNVLLSAAMPKGEQKAE